MYKVFLDEIQIPTPGKIRTKIKNNNKVISLISDGDVNLLKDAGLTEISFDYLAKKGETLSLLSSLKKSKAPFQFKVIRPGLFETDITVSLEDYEIKEEDKHITDQVISVKLKQYKPYGTKTLTIIDENSNEASVEEPRPSETSPAPKTEPKSHTVSSGDTLWGIANKYYGDGSQYTKLAEANGISDPNFILDGQSLIIPV